MVRIVVTILGGHGFEIRVEVILTMCLFTTPVSNRTGSSPRRGPLR
jgi:hypothetical protein